MASIRPMSLLACPQCNGAELDDDVGAGWRCGVCNTWWPSTDGIGRFLTPARAAHYDAFLRDYTAVRHAEGRAGHDDAYYRRLPEPTLGDPLFDQWRMRAVSWRALRARVLRSLPVGAVVVDVGAGVGWLSNRAAAMGFRAVAFDLSVDADDGLGAVRRYAADGVPSFGAHQAEMGALPLRSGVADAVVFNASLHYATDLTGVLADAVRVLRPGGVVVVMDSPLYRRPADGEAMVAERHTDFERRFGTRSDSVPSIGFLTMPMLRDASPGIEWSHHRPWYGWRWAWKPWRARLRRRRAPSRFELLVGKVRP